MPIAVDEFKPKVIALEQIQMAANLVEKRLAIGFMLEN